MERGKKFLLAIMMIVVVLGLVSCGNQAAINRRISEINSMQFEGPLLEEVMTPEDIQGRFETLESTFESAEIETEVRIKENMIVFIAKLPRGVKIKTTEEKEELAEAIANDVGMSVDEEIRKIEDETGSKFIDVMIIVTSSRGNILFELSFSGLGLYTVTCS